MLVLSRKKNETIVIGGNVTIVVTEIRGYKVRLGVKAPKSVSVHRGEVQEAIDRNGVDTTRTDDPVTTEELQEISQLDSLTEKVRKEPGMVEEYDLRNIAILRRDTVKPDSRLHRRLTRFIEFVDGRYKSS